MNIQETSKFISLILRHKPETIGITLDEHGWANVDELIAGISRTHEINREILEEIVRTDNKQRYSFNEDKTLIRANQGHSIPVDVELEEVEPPKYLYHGTGEKFRESIDAEGLKPKSRLYVHLSEDIETATKVGSRHGKPVVYRVFAGWMHKNGFRFYKSVNGVWLTKDVPTKYIKRETFDEKELAVVIKEIRCILSLAIDDNAVIDRSDRIFELEKKFSWEVLQQGLFRLLLDDSLTSEEYQVLARVFWLATEESRDRKANGEIKLKFKKKTIIGLLYYRLYDNKDPYGLIWNVVCNLYHLDYCNSEYSPFEDEKVVNQMKKYGIDLRKER
jgi:putative RNA 2'-phosphotransferase